MTEIDWPWHFVDLTAPQIEQRRQLLDRYALYAQLSPLVPILIYQLFRLAVWVSSERTRADPRYEAVPTSSSEPQKKASPSTKWGATWRSTKWWMGGEVTRGWGTRTRWAFGLLWASWLMFLSVHHTGDDYMHVTKRFGIIAASQLPWHYILFMKSRLSPIAFAFRISHEEINPYHRTLGRIIVAFLLLHGTWYLNFFIQKGILQGKLTSPVVIIGLTSLFLLMTIASTSLALVRQWSYRVFFICHLVIGISILPILFFHAGPLRYFTLEAGLIFIVDIVSRKLDTFTGFSTITQIPDTTLVKITVPLPESKMQRIKAAPGQHVYLSIPPRSRPGNLPMSAIYEVLFNPFTIAEVHATSISLVLRVLKGPTTNALNMLTHLSKANPPIHIEGPNGSARYFPNFATDFDRVLLVAGGVGATFLMPIYREIQDSLESKGISSDKVKLVWTMSSTAETSWAAEGGDVKALEADPGVELYSTGAIPKDETQDSNSSHTQNQSLELEDFSPAFFGARPDLRSIVNKTFRHGQEERVAVLVCGPNGMAEDLREHVGRWAKKGRDVWWHNESFGL